MDFPALLPRADATILFVHAHPDDETIVTGATMAACAAAGARVVLVTCTRGELGEVIPPELGHLEVGRALRLPHEAVAPRPPETDDAGHPLEGEPSPGAGLAAERERELAAALSALGVREHIWLGQGLTAPASGPAVFRDSGMQWGPDGRAMAANTVLPGSFSRVPLAETAPLLAAAIRELKPDVVVTYASDGGYGHPDHVRTHELTMAALAEAAAPADGGDSAPAGAASPTGAPDLAGAADLADPAGGWRVPAVYTIVSDRPERPLEDGVPRIAVAGDLVAKTAAMAAHRTQITVDEERFALSDNVWRDINPVEEFVALDVAAAIGSTRPAEAGTL